MLRPFLILAALGLSTPSFAQGHAGGLAGAGAADDCSIRMNAAPSAWMIQGYDPFDSTLPEGTFGVTFTNESDSTCRFAPVFQLDEPPFGLSKGTGRQIRYVLLNLTQSQDSTPRTGRSQRTVSQADIQLEGRESRTVLFKLLAEPNDVQESGVFTEDITLEAQDSRFRSLGGTRIVLGITVLPSARLGLSGAYSMSDGHAVVNLGDLREGLAPVPLHLRVSSTGRYEISVTSANAGRLRLGSTEWQVPYSLAIGGNAVTLAGTATLAGPKDAGFRQDSLPIQFVIGDVSDRRAGVYSDVITVAVTAR